MRRFLNALMAEWKTKTGAEKAKTILHGVIMIGGGVIGNSIGDRCSVGRSKVENACVRVTGWALGSAITGVAAKAMDETIDQFDGLLKDRKDREGSANA